MADGFISDEDINKIREANDLVSVLGDYSPVKQKGRDFWCCCPIHHEKTPSLKIDQASQIWHCFGCGEGGDVFAFVMKNDGISFPEAARMLADRAHIDITPINSKGGSRTTSDEKERLRKVCAETAAFYHTQLMRGKSVQAQAAREYLASRNLGGEVPTKWQLGFAPGSGSLVKHLRSLGFSSKEMIDANVAVEGNKRTLSDRFYNRIMFPISDQNGAVIAFGGRIFSDGGPKYMNSNTTPLFNKSTVLYGLDKAKNTMASTGIAIIVEGYTDVIALHQAGVTNAVATLGTALTNRHVNLLSRFAKKKIIYLFDGDEAGKKAADKALSFIDDSMTPEAGKNRVELAAVTLPDNLDPAEFVAARGVDELKNLLDSAKPLLLYGIERILASYDLSTLEGRAKARVEALAVLAPIKDSLLAKDYAVLISSRTKGREEDVLAELAKLTPPSDRFKSSEEQNSTAMASTNSDVNLNQPQSTPSQVSYSVQSTSQLSPAEITRRNFEREFLCLCYFDAAIALSYASSLAQTTWHERIHEVLAETLLVALEENPQSNVHELLNKAQSVLPSAGSILTSATMASQYDPNELAQFLSEELAIGDMEESISALKSQIEAYSAGSEEYDGLFAAIAELQKSLSSRKAQHKPL